MTQQRTLFNDFICSLPQCKGSPSWQSVPKKESEPTSTNVSILCELKEQAGFGTGDRSIGVS